MQPEKIFRRRFYFSKKTDVVSLFFFNIFPGIWFKSIQVGFITRTGMYYLTPKGALYDILSALWNKKKSSKFSGITPLCMNFSIPETFWTTKRAPPHELFSVTRKVFDIFFLWYRLLWFTQIFAPDRWATPTLSCSQLVIFCSIFVICKKNYSFSRVLFLFSSVQNYQLFLFKNKWQQYG